MTTDRRTPEQKAYDNLEIEIAHMADEAIAQYRADVVLRLLEAMPLAGQQAVWAEAERIFIAAHPDLPAGAE